MTLAIDQDADAMDGKGTVLLVDDEAMLVTLVRRMLGKLGFAVLAAESPERALVLAREHTGEIRLLLTDVVMPEMSGRELCQRLRQGQPDLACLFMSGYAADIIAPNGVLEPNIHFIQKPFRIGALAASIRNALGH